MKTAAKVFLILGIVGFSIAAFIIFISMFFAIAGAGPLALVFLLYILIALVPVAIDAVALKKLNKAKTKSELTGISIAVLIFGGMIPGILMLCLDEKDFDGYEETSASSSSKKKVNNPENLEAKLEELKKLHDNGTLSDDEYASARKKIIDESF